MENSILDVRCPHCSSIAIYSYNTDENELFSNGTGHYYTDYQCKGCGKTFRAYIEFDYTITDISYR